MRPRDIPATGANLASPRGRRPSAARALVLGLASLFAALGPAPPVAAQEPGARDRLLVSTEWLAARLGDPGIVLLHVGAEEDYRQEHIPGARYVSHRMLSHPASHEEGHLILELPEPAVLQQTLRGFGIDETSTIVVYWGSEWVTPTARTIFTLDWAGLGDRTVLLDGGLGAWKAAGGAVTAEVPAPATGDVIVRPRVDLVVDAEWVRAHATESPHALVDGRAAAFYDGVREDRGEAGHIPGAGSLPWTVLIDETLHLKDPAALRALFAAAGVEPGERVVAYCHIGQFATLVIFAARTLGHDAALYDGAFQDWAERELPVVATAGAAP
ncbi:MAG: sulfurtransferase [Gemmatimonadota bacterium]